MTRWRFFDARCTVGRHYRLGPGGLHSPDDLLAEMDHYDVWEALVVDSISRESHPLDGNRRVLEVAAGRPRLHPAWAALPPGADEQPEPEEFLRQMREHRVGALFLFTGQYRISLSDWCLDALLEPMAEARVPVFVVPDETGPGAQTMDRTDWDGIVAMCRRWPALPVVVSEFRIRRSQRTLYRALDACPNLRIELSGYWLHHGVEYITRRWGSERLLFGSNWPTFGQHMTLATLSCADIDEEDKRKIAGDNLRELIAWCGPDHPEVEPTRAADEFVRFGRTGERPEDMEFCDCHGHLGGRWCHYHLPDCDLESIVGEMRRLGDRQACVFSFTGVSSDEFFGNDVVADAVRRYPNRFIGFTMLNQHRGRNEMRQELERCARLGLRGVKLLAYRGVKPAPYYEDYPEEGLLDVPCQWVHERKQIILNHNWGPPAQLERLLAAYPDACFINGHTSLAYADLMERYPNLYICSCPLLGPRECEEVVERIGADRLLFGTDLQDLPIAWGLGPILFARLPVEQKRMILGGNLQRLLAKYSLSP
ncbi:MAG: amidohydrolase family protein [Candidatus Brocadiae bacterium]|nr:amidohydrolase family protein [Candidatus Brocadiia bacterium]